MTAPQQSGWWSVEAKLASSMDELLLRRLHGMGCRCCYGEKRTDGDTVWSALVPRADAGFDALVALSLALSFAARESGLAAPALCWEAVEQPSFPEHLEALSVSMEVGSSLRLRSRVHSAPEMDDRISLTIPPSPAMGWNHPSTLLCLRSLESHLRRTGDSDLQLADIGCGTGVLAIAAVVLGASRVLALDVDPVAVEETRRIAALNGVAEDRLVARCGSTRELLEMLERPLHGIVSNLREESMLAVVPELRTLCSDHTWCILSGFRTSWLPTLGELLHRNGWAVGDIAEQDGHACVTLLPRR